MENYHEIYSTEQIEKINSEFKRLKDHCYLDHTGATLYSDTQISEVHRNFTSNVYGNPHAFNISSKYTGDAVDQIRYEMLQFFNTNPEEYSLVFVANATAALKIVAENFVYKKEGSENGGTFLYLEDNHTSVLGMREFTPRHKILPTKLAYQVFDKNVSKSETATNFETNSLFAYPAQCNFSGTKYPLEWINKVHEGALNNLTEDLNDPTEALNDATSVLNGTNGALNGLKIEKSNWFCCLDAASFAPSSRLDLAEYKPDFVCISFYKIFGYPTGVGALLIRNSSGHILQKKYFGGGTVEITLPKEHVFRSTLHKRFEDGTVPFLAIIALRQGLETHKRLNLTIDLISKHVFYLARYVHHELLKMHHFNEKPVVILYHDSDFENVNIQGGIVNFNLLRDNGEHVGYSEVLQMANLYKIHLRTGCLCNPGACRRLLNLSLDDAKKQYEAGHVCGDQNDLIDGYPTGSCRISFGYMSTKENADHFLKMIKECFVTEPIIFKNPSNLTAQKNQNSQCHHINSPNSTKLVKIIVNNSENSPSNSATITTSIQRKQIMRHDLPEKIGVLKNIYIYPIKSCGAFAVNQKWEVELKGLKYDREWMITTSNGVCFTQKHEPKLCLIKPNIDSLTGVLELTYPGCDSISVPLYLPDKHKISEITYCHSKVCGDRVKCYDYGDNIANWLNNCLQRSDLRLIRQLPDSSRINNKGETTNLSLVNEGQYLLVTTATVRQLAERIPDFKITHKSQEELTSRFRANFIVDIASAAVENNCQMIKIGELLFLCTGPCTRCQMICIDQTNGTKTVEPLKTLASMMKDKGRSRFGTYLSNLELNKKTIQIGEKVIFLNKYY